MANNYDFKHTYESTINQLRLIVGPVEGNKFAEKFLWFTIGEIIISCCDNINSDGGADLCGSLMLESLGTNEHCREVISAVKTSDSQYKETMREMSISNTMDKLGTKWLQSLRGDNDQIIDQMIAFGNKYSNQFLPALKDYIERWCSLYNPDYNKKGLTKEIREKEKEVKVLTQKLDGYREIKRRITY